MQVPSLTHRRFMLLAPLVGGQERTLSEIREKSGFPGDKSEVAMLFRTLHCYGIVEKFDVLRSCEDDPSQVRKQRVVRITDYGRELWQETADFYAWILNDFVEQSQSSGDERILHRQPVQPNYESEENCRIARAVTCKNYWRRRKQEKPKGRNKDGRN